MTVFHASKYIKGRLIKQDFYKYPYGYPPSHEVKPTLLWRIATAWKFIVHNDLSNITDDDLETELRRRRKIMSNFIPSGPWKVETQNGELVILADNKVIARIEPN